MRLPGGNVGELFLICRQMADNYLEKKFEEHLRATVRPAAKHQPRHTGHVVVIADGSEWCSTVVRSMRVAGNRVTLISEGSEDVRRIAMSNGADYEEVREESFLELMDKIEEVGERHGKVEVVIGMWKSDVIDVGVSHFKGSRVEGRAARLVVCLRDDDKDSDDKIREKGCLEGIAVYGIKLREETEKQALGRMVRFLTEGEVVVRSGETLRL